MLVGTEALAQHRAHPAAHWSHPMESCTSPGGSDGGAELVLLGAAPTALRISAGKLWGRNRCSPEVGCGCRMPPKVPRKPSPLFPPTQEDMPN